VQAGQGQVGKKGGGGVAEQGRQCRVAAHHGGRLSRPCPLATEVHPEPACLLKRQRIGEAPPERVLSQ